MNIHYTYKIINTINGKIYYGKHSQEFGFIDSYIGSGLAIAAAVKKYGKDKFKKRNYIIL